MVLVFHAEIDRTAIEKKDSVIGIELERPVEIGNGVLRLVPELIDKTAIGVNRRLFRIKLDGAIEIGERAVKPTPVAKGTTARLA
jgi:hypothetical protein